MAELFREELSSPEFRSAFHRIVFAILNDHNAGCMGNYRPFKKVFG